MTAIDQKDIFSSMLRDRSRKTGRLESLCGKVTLGQKLRVPDTVTSSSVNQRGRQSFEEKMQNWKIISGLTTSY